jgi:hypothetical protein
MVRGILQWWGVRATIPEQPEQLTRAFEQHRCSLDNLDRTITRLGVRSEDATDPKPPARLSRYG